MFSLTKTGGLLQSFLSQLGFIAGRQSNLGTSHVYVNND